MSFNWYTEKIFNIKDFKRTALGVYSIEQYQQTCY